MLKYYGTPDNRIHCAEDKEAKTLILKNNPEAVELERLPLRSESYIYSEGFVSDELKIKAEELETARMVFNDKVKEGFLYNGHTFQCDEIDQVRWTKGVKIMERHLFETANAVDIDNNEWEMTLNEMKEIRDLAEDTWFTYWFEYQGIKNDIG